MHMLQLLNNTHSMSLHAEKNTHLWCGLPRRRALIHFTVLHELQKPVHLLPRVFQGQNRSNFLTPVFVLPLCVNVLTGTVRVGRHVRSASAVAAAALRSGAVAETRQLTGNAGLTSSSLSCTTDKMHKIMTWPSSQQL